MPRISNQNIHITKIPQIEWATNVASLYHEFRALRGEITFVGDCSKIYVEILGPGNRGLIDNLFQITNPRPIPFDLNDVTATSLTPESATSPLPDVPICRLLFKAYSPHPAGTPDTVDQQLETPNSKSAPYFKMSVTNTSPKS